MWHRAAKARATSLKKLTGVERAATAQQRLQNATSGFVSSLVRYWWVVAFGVVVAVGVTVLAARVKQNPVEYTATSQILVTSRDAPYFRTAVTNKELRSVGLGAQQSQQAIVASNPPDTRTLVDAANLYPLLIQSDLVAQERNRLYGALPGNVTAKTVFSTVTENRFESSGLPVIEVTSSGLTRSGAVELGDKTVQAFTQWIGRQQAEGGVKPNQQIVIAQLTGAHVTGETGGSVYAIPALLGIAVFLAFCGLAALLDALARTRQRVAATSAAAEDQGSAA